MAHDFVKDMIDQEEGRAGFRIVFTLGGGVLLLTALAAGKIYDHSFHAAMIAMAAALLLGAPLVWQALLDLWRGPCLPCGWRRRAGIRRAVRDARLRRGRLA